MRPRNSFWQGNFGYWQNDFIHDNMLMIGYYAWSGFLAAGRGMVCFDVDGSAIASKTTSLDLVQFSVQFIAKPQLMSHMSIHSFSQESIAQLLCVVNHYNPHRDVILLLTANAQTEINLLKNLKITPLECTQQVRRRWDEFQPCLHLGIVNEHNI